MDVVPQLHAVQLLHHDTKPAHTEAILQSFAIKCRGRGVFDDAEVVIEALLELAPVAPLCKVGLEERRLDATEVVLGYV